jgi:hypothetical protein
MKVSTTDAGFKPVSITFTTPQELADVVGALGAYGKGKTKAKKTIREAGLLDGYSGNARKTARSVVVALAEAAGFDVPDFGSASVNEELVDEALSE